MNDYKEDFQNRFYICYSAKIKKYLTEAGVRYIFQGVQSCTENPNTFKWSWLYDKTNGLLVLLDRYFIENPRSKDISKQEQ